MGHVPAGIVNFFAAFGVAGVAAGRGPGKGGASRGPGGGQRRQGEGWGLGAYGWAVAWPGEGGSSDGSGHGLGSFRLEFGTNSCPPTIMGLELVRGNPGIQSYGLPSEGLVSCRLGHQTFDKG